jgi:hypothetical protein
MVVGASELARADGKRYGWMEMHWVYMFEANMANYS